MKRAECRVNDRAPENAERRRSNTVCSHPPFGIRHDAVDISGWLFADAETLDRGPACAPIEGVEVEQRSVDGGEDDRIHAVHGRRTIRVAPSGKQGMYRNSAGS